MQTIGKLLIARQGQQKLELSSYTAVIKGGLNLMFSALRPLAILLIGLVAQIVVMSSASSLEKTRLTCADIYDQNLELANRGDTAAQRVLGDIYANGYCVDQDYSVAINWYKKAAINNDGASMLELGNIYGRGYGVEPNLDEALKWLKLAQENGQVTGRVYGFLYLDGILVGKSISRAYSLFSQAAEQGDPAAQYTVGLEYFRGKFLIKNPQQALKWLTLSAENGYGKSYRVLGGIYAYGSYGIKRDNAKAAKWLALAKDQDTETALDIAEMFYEGRGVDRNVGKAIVYYSELAEDYVLEAHLKLGQIYYSGPPLTLNYVLAEEHLQMAEALGSAEAAYHLGLMWLNGQGHSADRSMAIAMFERAANNGYVFANYYLGLITYNRPKAERDLRFTYNLFAAAAESRDPDLAAEAHAAKDAVAVEMGLISPLPGTVRVDKWSGRTPGDEYLYVHRPRKEWIPPVTTDEEDEQSGSQRKKSAKLSTYDPPPPPMLKGIPGGDINSIDSRIDPVFQ